MDNKIKGVFLDYTGTMVREDGEDSKQLIKFFLTHSDFSNPEEALAKVWGIIKKMEQDCYLDSFMNKPTMVEHILQYCVENFGLHGDLEVVKNLWAHSWTYAPLFDDVKEFFEACPYPIYVITNDDLCYVEEAMKINDLKPAGIVSAEMVRACKPHREIFEKALEMSGLEPDEVIHIGDSVTSDVKSAAALGITPILIDRAGKSTFDGCRVIHSLKEALK